MCIQIRTCGLSWLHQSTLSNLLPTVFCHITSCNGTKKNMKSKTSGSQTNCLIQKTNTENHQFHIYACIVHSTRHMTIHRPSHNQVNLICNFLRVLVFVFLAKKGAGFSWQGLFLLKSNQILNKPVQFQSAPFLFASWLVSKPPFASKVLPLSIQLSTKELQVF